MTFREAFLAAAAKRKLTKAQMAKVEKLSARKTRQHRWFWIAAEARTARFISIRYRVRCKAMPGIGVDGKIDWGNGELIALLVEYLPIILRLLLMLLPMFL